MGFAALAVVISHYYGIFWQNREAVASLIHSPILPMESHAVPEYISWLHVFPTFNWGAYGVALFFLISGFVIPFSLQKLSWTGFLINRFLRIFPTYIIGFSITIAAIFVSCQYFQREWPFSWQEILIHYIPGIRDIMLSKGIDGIIWTLEIEIKFYIICTFLILWFRQQSLKVFFAPILLFALALYIDQVLSHLEKTSISAGQLAATYITISQYIIYMFIGVTFNYLHCKKIDASNAFLGIGFLFMLFCIHWHTGPYSENISIAWNYAFALLTFSFAWTFPNIFKANRLFNFLADISYPLYIIHGVAGYIIIRIMLDMGFKAWLSLLTVTTAFFILSWLLHVLIEKPSINLGRTLTTRLTTRSLKDNF